MSPKIIIWIPGKPTLHGYKRREFTWSASHGCYLYEGRGFELHEFNEKFAKSEKTNADLNPRVKVILEDANQSAPEPVQQEAPAATGTREITADEAEEVLSRLRPERLKKKTGPKPQVMEVG